MGDNSPLWKTVLNKEQIISRLSTSKKGNYFLSHSAMVTRKVVSSNTLKRIIRTQHLEGAGEIENKDRPWVRSQFPVVLASGT